MGCVALKEIKLGTMILQEKPQLKLKSGSWSFQDLMIAFQQMVKVHSIQILTLGNIYVLRKHVLGIFDPPSLPPCHQT